jgi:hypothetical protein
MSSLTFRFNGKYGDLAAAFLQVAHGRSPVANNKVPTDPKQSNRAMYSFGNLYFLLLVLLSENTLQEKRNFILDLQSYKGKVKAIYRSKIRYSLAY